MYCILLSIFGCNEAILRINSYNTAYLYEGAGTNRWFAAGPAVQP